MLGVFADDHDFSFALDDLAFLADLLNGWFDFHCVLPYLSCCNLNAAYFARQVMRPLVRS